MTKQLAKWFTEYGWPSYIRSDGGPQFRTEFTKFCKENRIKHELASPYNPESNGLAEAAVKNLKAIVLRCREQGEDTKLAIAAWRNMARTDGKSPSQLFFGRRQRQQLLMTAEQGAMNNQDMSGRDKAAAKAQQYRNAHTHELEELKAGSKVRMQHHLTGKWDICVTIINKREGGHAYNVRGENGKTYIRGRRLLKLINNEVTAEEQEPPDPKQVQVQTPLEPRKRGRPKKGTEKKKEEVMPRRSARVANGVTKITVSRITIEYGRREQQAQGTRTRGEDRTPEPAAKPNNEHGEQRVPSTGTSRTDTEHSSASFGVLSAMGSLDLEGREVEADKEAEETRENQGGDHTNGGAADQAPQIPHRGGFPRGDRSENGLVIGDGRPDQRNGMADLVRTETAAGGGAAPPDAVIHHPSTSNSLWGSDTWEPVTVYSGGDKNFDTGRNHEGDSTYNERSRGKVQDERGTAPVSYTHLTLPTIYSV